MTNKPMGFMPMKNFLKSKGIAKTEVDNCLGVPELEALAKKHSIAFPETEAVSKPTVKPKADVAEKPKAATVLEPSVKKPHPSTFRPTNLDVRIQRMQQLRQLKAWKILRSFAATRRHLHRAVTTFLLRRVLSKPAAALRHWQNRTRHTITRFESDDTSSDDDKPAPLPPIAEQEEGLTCLSCDELEKWALSAEEQCNTLYDTTKALEKTLAARNRELDILNNVSRDCTPPLTISQDPTPEMSQAEQVEWLEAQKACLDMIESLKAENLRLEEEVEEWKFQSKQSCEKWLCARKKLSNNASSAVAIMKQELADLRSQNRDLQTKLDTATSTNEQLQQEVDAACKTPYDLQYQSDEKTWGNVTIRSLAIAEAVPAVDPPQPNQRCNYSFIFFISLLVLFLVLLAAVVYFRAQLQGLFINTDTCKMYADRLETSQRWDTCHAKVDTATYKRLCSLGFC